MSPKASHLAAAVVACGLFPVALADVSTASPLVYATSDTQGIGRGNSTTVLAKCPRGHVIVSGGFEITRSGAVHPPHIYDSYPTFLDNTGWRSSAYNPETLSGVAQIQGSAVCLDRETDEVSLRTLYERKSITVPAASRATTEAVCPDRYSVIGGGFNIDGSVNTDHPFHMMGSFPTTSSGWAAEVFNPPGSPTITLEVHAVCLRDGPHRISYQVSDFASLPRNSIADAEVRCPRGQQVIGGGFDLTGRQAAYPPIILESYAVRGWRASAINAAFNPILTKPANLRAFAVCIRF